MVEDMIELTPDEIKAINSLKRLAKKWPKTLWLFAGNGLSVMKGDKKGYPIHTKSGNVDIDYVITTIDIQADGGDF